MIILNQDKDSIINFDNIDNIDITANSTIIGEEEPYTINYETSTRRQGLGIYQTEERAKEVLQKLIQSYREYRTAEVDGYTNVLEETAVYEMPED